MSSLIRSKSNIITALFLSSTVLNHKGKRAQWGKDQAFWGCGRSLHRMNRIRRQNRCLTVLRTTDWFKSLSRGPRYICSEAHSPETPAWAVILAKGIHLQEIWLISKICKPETGYLSPPMSNQSPHPMNISQIYLLCILPQGPGPRPSFLQLSLGTTAKSGSPTSPRPHSLFAA